MFAYTKRFSGKSKVSKGSQSFMLTLAYVQDPIVQFKTAEGYKEWPPYWTNHVHSTHEMLLFHLKDYPTASSLGYEYASAVTSDAERVSGKSYADIVSLAARQVLGATYFSGTSSNPVLFLKEISSNGNFQTVDVIFPSMPFFLYTNPEWLGYLLEPLLMHQEAGLYPNKYSIHDLGKHFPNATGHPDGQDEPMPLEECGNMLIMALAYVQALIGKYGEKDGREAASHWIKRFGSYWLWEHWTGYLVEYGLVPDLQRKYLNPPTPHQSSL